MKRPIIEFEVRQSVRLYPNGLTSAFVNLEIAELKFKRAVGDWLEDIRLKLISHKTFKITKRIGVRFYHQKQIGLMLEYDKNDYTAYLSIHIPLFIIDFSYKLKQKC